MVLVLFYEYTSRRGCLCSHSRGLVQEDPALPGILPFLSDSEISDTLLLKQFVFGDVV